jgi:hypothetical protein
MGASRKALKEPPTAGLIVPSTQAHLGTILALEAGSSDRGSRPCIRKPPGPPPGGFSFPDSLVRFRRILPESASSKVAIRLFESDMGRPKIWTLSRKHKNSALAPEDGTPQNPSRKGSFVQVWRTAITLIVFCEMGSKGLDIQNNSATLREPGVRPRQAYGETAL